LRIVLTGAVSRSTLIRIERLVGAQCTSTINVADFQLHTVQ